MRATPYPNRLLELTIRLPETQARIVAYTVRSTLGWTAGIPGQRRASTVVSLRHLRAEVGRSSRLAVAEALSALVQQGVLEVTTPDGLAVSLAAMGGNQRIGLRLKIPRQWVVEGSA